MPNVKLNHIDLYYEIHGKGKPLMLIAGLASDSQSWQPVIETLSRHYLIITPDNRGSGRTTPHEIKISIQDIADDCYALITHLGLSSVNILGHSMGGFVAIDLVSRYPGFFNKLILAGTSASNPARNNVLFSDWASYLETGMNLKLWFRNMFYWIFSAHFFKDREAVNYAEKYAVEYPFPQSIVAFRNQVKAIARFNATKELSELMTKTLVIGGKEDLLFPPEVCAGLAQAIKGAELTLIAGAAHSIHIEQPQAFTNCILDFLIDQ